MKSTSSTRLRSTRKARPQGPLNTLPPAQRAALHRILLEPLTLERMAERIKRELGVQTSATAVSKYYHSHSPELLAYQAGGRAVELSGQGVRITIKPHATEGWQFTIESLPSEAAPDGQTKPE